jgi:DNA polymerase-1
MTKPLILVDGSSYLYRAFHAMPALANSKGNPTGAVYGMINMLRKLISDYDPIHMAVVFDAKGKTFREKLYDKYKANRPPMPSELVQQIEPIHEIIKALGLPLIMVEGVEADDVIGTLAKEAERNHESTIISTGDKDLAQLVNPHIMLINTMTDTLYNTDKVLEKFGIPPDLIVDYLALIGDSVDNIPGVPMVGPKTAVKWLNQFGSLGNIMLSADKITGKVGENLRGALSYLPLSKELATIKIDVDLNVKFSDLQLQKPNEELLIQLFQDLEFKNWLNELLDKNPKKTQNKYEHYITIFDEKVLDDFIQFLSSQNYFAFDTETTSLNYMDAALVGLSFAAEKTKGVYIPLQHDYPGAPKQLDRDLVLKKLKPIFENPNIKKIAHHMKYDKEILRNYGIHLQGIAFDTILQSYILDASGGSRNMDSLALKHLGWRAISYEDVAGKGAKQIPFNQVRVDAAATYAAEDADITLHLHEILWQRILKEPGLKYIFEEIEMPLVSVLAKMEQNGVLIDPHLLKTHNDLLEKRLQELESEITKLAGRSFNVNSPKQLQEILFTQLKLPVLQKTPGGQPSTADAVLQELAAEYLLPKLIIEFRAIAKLISTYTNKLPGQIFPKTQRVHTNYHQSGTATGRLSSSDPNLQNIPIRTAEGRRIREAFVAPKGYRLIVADYSQIELRIMAHMSDDANLLKAFAEDLDIHTATAAEILNIPLEQVTSDERRNAKAINFGLIYGMSAFGLAKQIGSSRDMAQTYIDRYFARYPGVMNYMENTRQKAHDRGYVETLFGRRLYLPEIHSSQIPRRKAAERAAINAPLQGSAADIIKKAMISLDHFIETHDYDAKMIMQVHDELVFEVAEKDVPVMLDIIRSHMMKAAELKVPLLVSIGEGDNWNSASKD